LAAPPTPQNLETATARNREILRRGATSFAQRDIRDHVVSRIPVARRGLLSRTSLGEPALAILMRSMAQSAIELKRVNIVWQRVELPSCSPIGEIGAPDAIRTCGLHLRRVAFYPAELRAHLSLPSPTNLCRSTDSDTLQSSLSFQAPNAPCCCTLRCAKLLMVAPNNRPR
jgi:hypothetical protein